jgi:hypothetical protein
MAFSAFVESFGMPTSTGNASRTTFPFQPKALFGLLTGDTAAGFVDVNPIYMNHGVAVSSSQRGAYTSGMINGSASVSNFRRGYKTDRFLHAVKQATNTEDAGIDLVSLNSDGYTYNVVVAPATSFLTEVIGFGGSDLSNAAVVSFEVPGSTGNFDVTTVGFEPDLVLLLANGRVATGYGGGGGFQLSAFNNAGEQFAAWGHIEASVPPSDASRGLRTDRAYYISTPSGGNVVSASYVSMLSNGFRLNFDTIADGQEVTALCLQGTFQHKILSFDKTTSAAPVNQDVDFGFPLSCAIVVSAQKTAGTTHIDHNRLCVGFTDGTNEKSYAWAEEEQVSTTNVDGYIATDKGYVKIDNTSQTIDASADLSFTGNNLRFAWDVNDGVATQVAVIGLGSAAAGSSIGWEVGQIPI